MKTDMNLTRFVRNIADVTLVTLLLLLLAEGVSFLAIESYSAAKGETGDLGVPDKPNHGVEQARVYAEAEHSQNYTYKSFVGWEAEPATSELININPQRRRVTGFETAFPGMPTTHLFGGSTMWGTGVADSGTIPALLAPKISQNTINYGDKGYNSRQNLNRLIGDLANMSEGDTVIFYDGVNDAIQNCRSANSLVGHSRETQIKGLMEDAGQQSYASGVTAFFRQTYSYAMLNKVLGSADSTEQVRQRKIASVCADPENAEAVARFLIQNWHAAEDILRAREINFICALQPNPYTATSFVPAYHDPGRETSVRSVYPLVREMALSKNLACFADMTEIFDSDHYLDHCCHVNRDGNQTIANHFKIEMDKKRLQ